MKTLKAIWSLITLPFSILKALITGDYNEDGVDDREE